MSLPQETTPDGTSQKPAEMTPMMAQYVEIKTANPDCLLFYRMGDFYELFFDDAVEASQALGITLTKRGKHEGADIPMCGVPVHAADEYLQKLIALEYRVAVCEQLEDPAEAKKRGYKAVVKRDVVRLVTPGTLTEDSLLEPGRNNYFAVVARVRGSGEDELALSWIDISTGAFHVARTSKGALAARIATIDPREVLIPDAIFADESYEPVWTEVRIQPTVLAGSFFDSATASERLMSFFDLKALDAFGDFDRVCLSAAAAALSYVEKTQLGAKPALQHPELEQQNRTMLIDAATRVNLELVRTVSGTRSGTLLSSVDRTVTGPGARLLHMRIANPLVDPAKINARLDAVGYCLNAFSLAEDMRDLLKGSPDMERAMSRLSLGRAGPRDLASLRDGLLRARQVAETLADRDDLPSALLQNRKALETAPSSFQEKLDLALSDEPPLLARDGGFVRAGYRRDLDEARALRDESRKVIAALQADYADLTGIKGLKIKHNNVLGWFIEVTALHAPVLMGEPHSDTFIHRQTLANAVRFTTVKLSELQTQIANAAEEALAIELSVFEGLCSDALSASSGILSAAGALAALDVATAQAVFADGMTCCRPVCDDSFVFEIEGGRHPVVEQALSRDAGAFVANNCDLTAPTGDDAGKILLVTGPNMGGKSTYLRQNALITVLAQAGCYVPAKKAHIGTVDRLYSRVGASDDLARGRSTFMVEMIETAAILNQATNRSLVILDEIGRGTATYDGLSIAWAAIEHLHDINRSRALFATHFHEMTALSSKLGRLENATLRVREWKGGVVFLHEITPGAADRSYGIQVAKLAGLPAAVVQRARLVLEKLEEGDRKNRSIPVIDDLPLFSVQPAPRAEKPGSDRLTGRLKAVNPDELTPREALDLLYELKKEALQDLRGDQDMP